MLSFRSEALHTRLANQIDAVILNGSSLLTRLQIFGISEYEKAIAITSEDRDPKIIKAIRL